jgi:hypothetical protein
VKVLDEVGRCHAVTEVISGRIIDALDREILDAAAAARHARQMALAEVAQTSLPSLDRTVPLIPGRTMTKCLNIAQNSIDDDDNQKTNLQPSRRRWSS